MKNQLFLLETHYYKTEESFKKAIGFYQSLYDVVYFKICQGNNDYPFGLQIYINNQSFYEPYIYYYCF